MACSVSRRQQRGRIGSGHCEVAIWTHQSSSKAPDVVEQRGGAHDSVSVGDTMVATSSGVRLWTVHEAELGSSLTVRPGAGRRSALGFAGLHEERKVAALLLLRDGAGWVADGGYATKRLA